MNAPRKVKLFRNGRHQAVRIPRAFELPGDAAVMHREGDRLVIEPSPAGVPNARLPAVLAALAPLRPEDRLPDVANDPAGPTPPA